VLQAVRAWAAERAHEHDELRRVGVFGSAARGDYGVGSDVDLVAVVTHADRPFSERSAAWPTERLPVPADFLPYTEDEWQELLAQDTRFARMLRDETLWVWP
jgi:predicted nucleotidyltransferase